MAVIDRDLIRAINSGRCFALLGTGPSCELGVPSWKRLAEIAVEKMNSSQRAYDVKECGTLLVRNDYPRIFSLAEKVMGRDDLLAFIGASLTGSKHQGRIYEYVASWPFSCYLTTNFDDHLSHHLENIGLSFSVRRNSQDDMRVLRANSKNLIVKIHGDPTSPQDIVLTSEQYLDFQKGESRQYWRNKILSVLNMVDLVIIGYSVSDPDFQYQLQRAKYIASPDHPVFMFAADLDPDQIRKYYQQLNIRVIGYENKDGTHRELQRLLKRYDPFVAKRESPTLGLEPIDESTAILASSMHLFTQLRLADTTDACIEKAYACAILEILSGLPGKREVSIDTIRKPLVKETFAASGIDPTAMQKALDCLYSVGFISLSPDHLSVTLEPKGQEALAIVKTERDLLRETFERRCRLFLRREYPNLNDESAKSVMDALQIGLVRAYEKRGMEIARSAFSNDVVNVSDATDILETINRASSGVSGNDQRLAFADLMIEVVLRPDEEMKEYLAALSQGYFAYHALGLEPRCSRKRLDMAKENKWVLDSSIILPILALDCLNHRYAEDLLKRMQNLGFRCYTTERLFQETREHAWWAINNFADIPPDDLDLLQAAMAGPGYKQNLFLDGYIKWSRAQGAPSFHQYMSECLGSDYRKDLPGSIKSSMEYWEIEIMNFSQWPGFSEELWSERDDIAIEIEKLRKRYGTYKGESQCIAEAEVVLVTEIGKAAFLSQSGILNELRRAKPRMTWRPEAMYRFLALFSSAPTDIDLLYECMIQDFYYGGFDIIDKGVISKYVTPMIRQARMQLNQESGRYEQALGKKRFIELRRGFERVPDEQKPFYSMQFAFYVATQEIRKREAAEERATQAEETKLLADKERDELARLRAEKAERRRRAEKKRRRTESQRKRKRKKRKKK